ncbi:MAG TPA: M48 family metalloprotease [Actinomycetota bacterium]|nr:M48 family metalloprotease [Actinomycetota bacterium]
MGRPTNETAHEGSIVGRLYLGVGARLGRRLFEEVENTPEPRPRLTAATVLGTAIAVVVHAITLALIVGAALFFLTGLSIAKVVAGVLCLLVAWVLRPRLGKPPPGVLPRDRFPTLYELTDRMADKLGAPRVHGLTVVPGFTAFIEVVGWRRRAFLGLGLPLLVALDPQERVALLAHELAHRVNGDPRRGAVTGSALSTLDGWYDVLYPDPPGDEILEVVAAWLMVGLASVPRAIASLLVHLVWRESQRAEYLADALARRVAGTQATASMLRKLYSEHILYEVMQRKAVHSRNSAGLLDEFSERIKASRPESIPLQDSTFRLDATHPPTAFRVQFVESRMSSPEFTLADEDSMAIDRELEPLRNGIETELVDAYRATLYA